MPSTILAIPAAAALAGCALALSGCAPAPVEGPNLLLLTVDTLRADHLGFHGYERDTSPALDRFARSAVIFEEAQAECSWTLPSLASAMTALLPSSHGVWLQSSRLDPSQHTLAERLREAGWDTAAVVSNHLLGRQYGLHQGFTEYRDELSQAAVTPRLYSERTDDRVCQTALNWLAQRAGSPDGRPWFLWVHAFDPHAEYLAHPSPFDRFGGERDVDLYDGEIAFTDHHLGRVLARLEELDLADETIVVLWADHGEEFGDHGGSDHGHSLFQELVHVPLALRAPGVQPGRVTAPVRGVDLLPTLLELMDLPPAEEVEGRSLAAVLRGDDLEPRCAVAELELAPGRRLRTVRRGDHKLLVEQRFGAGLDESEPVALFDLALDPAEQRNRLADDPALVAELLAELGGQLARARRRAAAYAVSPPIDPGPLEAAALRALGYSGE